MKTKILILLLLGLTFAYHTIAQNLGSVKTDTITGITHNSALVSSEVVADGGSYIKTRGVCYSTDSLPTISNTSTIDSSGIGVFSSKLTGLNPSTKYYVRAYASNDKGTSYGAIKSFVTIADPTSGYGPIISDIEGNSYKTVYIGAQQWMGENLKTSKYNDGSQIQNITNYTTWGTLTTGAWSYYNNDTSKNDNYGKLYNWYALNPANNGNKNVCPSGWHVPIDAEWKVLSDYLVGDGGKLKEQGTQNWQSPNQGATNSTFFSALPGGYVDIHGGGGYGSTGYWWSSSEIDGTIANNMGMLNLNTAIYLNKDKNKRLGCSVRCLKDQANCNLKINVIKVVKNTSSTTCNGGASVSVIGGMPSYRINWSNGKSGAYASGLCAGNYTVIAVDSLGCSATAVIVITDTLPTTKQCEGFLINLNAIKNDLKGDTICTGSIITSIVGGKQPINTIWNNGKKDLSIFDLCKGSYTVYARDANGCVVTLTKEIGEDEKITLCEGFFANILVKNTIPSSSTSGCTGSLTTSINGGTAPYAFKWSNGATTSSLEKLCEGVYDVIITDSKNCSIKIQKYISKDSIVLNPCSTLIASLKVGNDKTGDAACTGYMYANVIGGKSPYTYVWSNKEILPGIKGLCKGDYSVLITDANKCQLKLEGQLGLDTIVNPCANFFAKIAGVQKTALSKCTGMLSVKVDGGLAPYDFNWSNGVKSPSATDLCAGKYYVEVKDAQGCKIALDGFVGIDSIVSSCEGFYAKVTSILNDKAGDNVCTGYIKTQTFGGKSPYAYKWNTGATTTNLDKACSGKYSLEITDANKCKFVLERVVGSDSIVDKCKSFYAYISEQTDDAEENPICEGKLAVKTVNGLAPFKFNWSTGETTASINELCYDTYKVLISDANQCQVVLCATVQKKKTENTKLEVIINTKDATSATACDGAAKIDVKGGTAPYYFYHSNGEVNFYRKGICSGVHSVIVKDSKGQVAELKFMISAPTNVFTTKPKKDSLIIDTVKTILTKECEIDFNAIDSVRIKEHKMLSKDSLRITWAIFSGTKIVYVSSIYKITKGKGNYTFNLEVYCEGKSLGSFLKAAEDVYIDAEAILGTVTNMETSMSVYPNPFSDQLTIIVPMNDNYTVMLMDITGKIVSQETFMQTNTLNLPLENVANGQYILKVNGTHFTATEKVVK